jgi:glucose-6-phosphate dehydrogenase assembly protein OpcA
MTPPSEESSPPEPRHEALTDFVARCDAIEEAYEFMLAYAAQGLPTEEGSTSGSQIRTYLRKCEAALIGLCDAVTSCVQRLIVDSTAPYDAFVVVVERDVRSAQAAVALVLAQPSISSQLVDNLNASIHLRAVLTDLFLLDEVLKK